MRRAISRIMFLSLWIVILVSGARGNPASVQEFSADMVNRVGEGTMSGKIYVANEKIRMEMPENIMIIRYDQSSAWMIMPSEKMYLKQSLEAISAPPVGKDFKDEITRESLGKDEVDGKAVEKFKVTYREGDKEVSVYQWVWKSQFPIRVEAVDGSWSTEFKNLSQGPQPAELFEIPGGYEEMAIPSFDLKGLMGM